MNTTQEKPHSAIIRRCLCLIIAGVLASCGGGDRENKDPYAAAVIQPTSAVVKLITQGTNTTINGIDATILMPRGVVLKSSSSTHETDPGVVIASGAAAAGSLITAVYTEATQTTKGSVRIVLVNATGFATGEFATVNADIVTGCTPSATDFSVVNFDVNNCIGNNCGAVSGVTLSYSVDIR